MKFTHDSSRTNGAALCAFKSDTLPVPIDKLFDTATGSLHEFATSTRSSCIWLQICACHLARRVDMLTVWGLNGGESTCLPEITWGQLCVMSSVTPPRVNHGCEKLMRWMTVLRLCRQRHIFERIHTRGTPCTHCTWRTISSAFGQVRCPPTFVITSFVHGTQLCTVEETDKCPRN